MGGNRFYDLDGRFHREEGPVIEFASGVKFWYKHGHLHRLDGPAKQGISGTNYWYIEGEQYTELEFIDCLQVIELAKQATIESGINTEF